MRIGGSCAAVTGYDFPLGQSPKSFGGEGGKKVRCRTGVISQEPEYLSGPPHSVAVALCAARARLTETRLQQKLLRKKKNGSWAMRRLVANSGPNKSDSRSWRKLVMQNRPVWFFPVAILVFASVICHAEEATPTPSPTEAEVESVVVSATRFDIPLDQSPSTVSVV